jgi:hypothetical protein
MKIRKEIGIMWNDDKLTEEEKQAILYSKRWFRITNQIDDLKKIVSRAYALDEEDVLPYSIYHFVVELFLKLQKLQKIRNMEAFLLDLFKTREDSYNWESMIDKMIKEISNAYCMGLEIGEPDYSLLEKYKEE